MGTQTVTEGEFNVLQFEKQLTTLKDSQEAINNCCQWCLQNRVHHKKIVNAWLNVLKRVKVEQRLILFYLANDVVQYSKRRNFDYVESWGIALQKATTMVRDEKVKHKILRIFKIWEQRSVYNEEFISDLCGLLSVLPSAPKSDEPHEFQPNYVINKIKTCSKLEKDTDTKLKLLKEHNPKIQIDDGLIASLKDRAHMDDVEKEIEVFIGHMEEYINALKLEIKNRITVISVLKQAETQLEADRKDVKVVANAYKMFGTRVKTFQRKLDEHKETLNSPIPSPDINAPSPSPDSDLDLPDEAVEEEIISHIKEAPIADYNPKAELQYSTGYYTPNTSENNPDVSNSFLSTNGFSSFMGSETFNLENFNSTLFSNVSNFNNTSDSTTLERYTPPLTSVQNPPPVSIETTPSQPSYGYDTIPLLPPPMPPFTKPDVEFGSAGGYGTTTTDSHSYGNSYVTGSYETTGNTNYETEDNFREDLFEPPLGANPYPPSEEYNPEEDVQTWEPDASWNGMPPAVPETDTPESPPMFEKESYSDPVEYHESLLPSGAVDVDHRVLPGISNDMDDSMGSLGAKDVDHRNLISLTGSPGHSNSQNLSSESLWNQSDQDYRILPTPPIGSGDQDYRLGFNLDQLKLPPPPPPPPKFSEHADPPMLPLDTNSSPRPSSSDNIDMDLSDDEGRCKSGTNLKVIVDASQNDDQSFLLEPPPPLPELPDDVDTTNFLDDLSNDMNEYLQENVEDGINTGPLLLPPPPMMNFGDLVGPPLMPPNMNTSLPPPMDRSLPPLDRSLPPLDRSLPPLDRSLPPPPLHPPPMMGPPPPGPLGPPPGPWLAEENLDPMNQQNHGPLSEPGHDESWSGCDESWSEEMFPGEMELHPPNNWMGPPMQNMSPGIMFSPGGFRGRGNNRGYFRRGRGRGGPGPNFSPDGYFRGNFRGNRGSPRGNRGKRGFFPRGGNNFRANFRGGF